MQTRRHPHSAAFHAAPLPILSRPVPPSFPPPNVSSRASTFCSPSILRVRPALHPGSAITRIAPHSCAPLDDWKQLKPHQFEARLQSRQLAICFVGMSNCGKSHWSRALHEQLDFSLISVDDVIEEKLKPELAKDGHEGIGGLAAWMGFPSDARFARNQAIYLEAEEDVTARAAPTPARNSVLDTTGSVVYLSEATRARLTQRYLVVHLEASDDMLDVMTENYFQTPKPVVWGDAFAQRRGEDANAALRRCYPILLRERRERYAKMAHVTVPATISLSRQVDLRGFLDQVREGLLASSLL